MTLSLFLSLSLLRSFPSTHPPSRPDVVSSDAEQLHLLPGFGQFGSPVRTGKTRIHRFLLDLLAIQKGCVWEVRELN